MKRRNWPTFFWGWSSLGRSISGGMTMRMLALAGRLGVVMLLLLGAPWGGSPVWAQSDAEARETRVLKLEKRIELLEQRLRDLEGQKGLCVAAAPGLAPPPAIAQAAPVASAVSQQPAAAAELASTETRLPVSGYMDFHFNKPRGEPAQLDFHRFVLLFGHSFSERIKFWSELEVEHALVEGREEKGALELEQAYLDFLVRPSLNFRGGMLLAPVGLINERHEPPSFYGVERPFVDTVILPSTWFDTGVGIFGDLGKGWTYKAYLMSPLDATGFSAEKGIRGGRQEGFQSVLRNVAQTGRLEYHGPSRLSLGLSFWRGGTGFNLRGVNPRVRVLEFDGRYSITRFDFRGEFAHVDLSKAAELNLALQRRTGVNPNIARQMRGFYLEGAAHVWPRRWAQDLTLFTRYENFDTQFRMPRGFLPLREFDRSAWVIGTTYYPEPDVALKMDYTVLRNHSSLVRAISSLNFGIGWWF